MVVLSIFQGAPERLKNSMLKCTCSVWCNLWRIKAKPLISYLSGSWNSSNTQTEYLHLILETWLLLGRYFCIYLWHSGGNLLVLSLMYVWIKSEKKVEKSFVVTTKAVTAVPYQPLALFLAAVKKLVTDILLKLQLFQDSLGGRRYWDKYGQNELYFSWK